MFILYSCIPFMGACVYMWYFKNSIVNISLATNLFFFFFLPQKWSIAWISWPQISANFLYFSFPKNKVWCKFGDEHRGSSTAPSHVNPGNTLHQPGQVIWEYNLSGDTSHINNLWGACCLEKRWWPKGTLIHSNNGLGRKYKHLDEASIFALQLRGICASAWQIFFCFSLSPSVLFGGGGWHLQHVVVLR